MNPYAILVPAALLLDWILGLVADLCNLRALSPEPPEGFRDVYDAERYRRSQEYTGARTRFALVPTSFHLVVLFAFWYAGGFRWLDEHVRDLGVGPVLSGLVFIGLLGIARSLLQLPFSYWSTFVIEERFGFNKSTRRTFFLDALKGLLLAVALGGPLLAAILWFFEAAGPFAWVWCWVATVAFTLVVQFVAPTWIMPLFNRFEPLEEGELRDAVMDYAKDVSFPLEGMFVIDGSRRSTKANAFFTGFGSRKRVALYDTLIEKQSTEELVAIVAHEVGHYKHGHIKKRLVLGAIQGGVVFFLLSIFLRDERLFSAFLVEEPSTYAGLIFFSLLFSPIDLALSLVFNALSRRDEFEADRFARRTTGSPERLVSALKKLSADSLANLTPHPFYVKLHHSHPPLPERVAALRAGDG